MSQHKPNPQLFDDPIVEILRLAYRRGLIVLKEQKNKTVQEAEKNQKSKPPTRNTVKN
jgi:hypothetical protein